MGRDFSFQWQPPSQWGEMVRLGMGHTFKTLLFQPLKIKFAVTPLNITIS